MKSLITTVVLAFSFASFAQNVEFKASNFKADKEGFKKAVEAIKKGDEYFEKANEAIFKVQSPGLNYAIAKKHYMIAQDLNDSNGELNFKIGVCLANSSFREKCIDYLYKAYKLDPKCDPFMDYYYGYALQLDGKFDQAVKSYNKFKDTYKKSDEFNKFTLKRKKECAEAKKAMITPVRAWVDNVSELNTPQNDHGPSVSTDGGELIMTSNRPNDHSPNEVGTYDDDIYSSTFYDGKWSKPKPIPAVNSTEDDVSNNISYDGTRMLLHSVEAGQTDIYESRLVGANWTAPEKLHFQISTKNSQEVYASYSADGWSIFFGRQNRVGQTGIDIMYSSMQSKIRGDYKAAQKISTVNSRFNEGPIYVHIDGETMYIASQGNGSLGGYDIFVSYNTNGIWSKPKNLGYPINTPYDDFYFSATANGKYAYISSDRAGGKGGYDIYKVTFWGEPKSPDMVSEDYLLASAVNPMKDNALEAKVDVKKKSFTVFKGKTIDAISRKPVEANIEITDNSTGKVIETFTTNSATGKFIITLASGKNYGIAVKAKGYLFHSENFDIPMGSADNLVNKVIELKNIAIGSKIALRNIFFDTGKSKLRPESNPELDRLVKLMKDVPALKVEISGHTDNTGSATLNEGLSQDRAQAVVNYLKSKGVTATRMQAKGYGASRPVASNGTSAGRQENRRTEFEIIAN